MSKSILILETPKNCISCPMCKGINSNEICCLLIKGKYNKIPMQIAKKEVPGICVLGKIPEKEQQHECPVTVNEGWDNGWNACLDRITGI